MKKWPIKLITVVALLLISGFAFADDISTTMFIKHNFFTISPSDQSVGMLTRLFGDVGIVLPGSPGLMGALFQKFNQALLMITVLTILSYTVFRSIIETAHSGEFLGKKFDSLWVPLRVALGIGLIVPTVSGYSIIQVIVMWVVLQGVGAADTLWKTALLYFQNHSSSFITPPHQPTDNKLAASTGQNILAGLYCMHSAAKNDYPRYSDEPLVEPTYHFSVGKSTKWNNVNFIYKGKHADVNCGSIQFLNPNQFLSTKGNKQGSVKYQKALAVQDAIQQLVTTLNGTAKNMVYLGNNTSDKDNPDNDESGFNPVATASAYLNSAVYLVADHNHSNNLSDKVWRAAYDDGWALAGAYYYKLAKANTQQAVNSSLTNSDVINNVCAISGDSAPGSSDPLKTACASTQGLLKRMWQSAPQGFMSDATPKFNLITPKDPISAIIGAVVNSIKGDFISQFYSGTQHHKLDPVVAASQFGRKMLSKLQTGITALVYAVMGLGLIAGICQASSPGATAFIGLLLTALPLTIMLICGLYVVGLMIGYYLPLVPYIIFFFGVMGWLLSVLESILAAPLVAMGVTYPEGHEMMGRADPALLLLTNIFLRPSIMIFGLLASMMFIYIGVNFINTTFGSVLNSVTGGSSLYGLDLFFILAIWAGLIVIFTQWSSTMLITRMVDSIMKWLNGGNFAQFGEYSGGEQELRGIAQTTAGRASEAGGEGIKMGQSIGEKAGSAIGSATSSSDSSSGADVKPDGGGGGSGDSGQAGGTAGKSSVAADVPPVPPV